MRARINTNARAAPSSARCFLRQAYDTWRRDTARSLPGKRGAHGIPMRGNFFSLPGTTRGALRQRGEARRQRAMQ